MIASPARPQRGTATPQTIDLAMTVLSANLTMILGPVRGLEAAKKIPVLVGLALYAQLRERTSSWEA